MLYLTSSELFAENLEIGLATGSMPPTFLRPRLDPQTRLRLESRMILRAGSMRLLLAERTASWCLLSPFEAEIALAAEDIPLAHLQSQYTQVDPSSLVEFFVRLYQRGLLRVNGFPGLPPTLLDDGALFSEAYLVEVLVTQKCNLACRYCLAEAGPDMTHLHPELAYGAVDAAFRLPVNRPLSIQLSGGEPFVNFALFRDLVTYIEAKRRESGRRVRLFTQSNGTLISDAIAEFVKKHSIAIGISCDGPSQFSDVSRPMLGGQSSNARTLRGMSTLRRHGVPFGVILVLNRANVEHPEEIIDFFADVGVCSLKVNPINMIGDAQRASASLAITGDQYFDFLDAFVERLIEGRFPLREANLAEYLRYLVQRTHNYRCMRSNCGAGVSFFLVDARGDVYPCAHSAGLPAWRLGNITEARAKAAHGLIKLGAQNDIVRKFPLRLVERIADARRCPWRHFCEGGCAVNAYQRFGTIQAPDTLCTFYERFYPRLLERLAASPEDFQTLLDLTLGKGRAAVVKFSLAGEPATTECEQNTAERSAVHACAD